MRGAVIGLVLVGCVWVVAGGLPTPAWAQADPPAPVQPIDGLSNYRLGAGDVISIRVFGEDEFTMERIRLTDAGTIFYPSVGEIRLRGMTLGELEQTIDRGLRGRILVNPRVSVEVVEYRPFFFTGMVKNPGSFPYQPGLTVRRAATLAGGFDVRASMRRIFIIREGDPDQKQQPATLDTPVGPGDLVTVGESFF
jgi:polysaccharide biosynthesis/export protein VpsN